MNRIDTLVVKAVPVASLAALGTAASAAAAQPHHAVTAQADGATDDTNPWT
jgi:hypothetical protein